MATVTVPVDADGDVTAYQRVDGTWQEVEGTTVTDGEAEIPVSQSGTVVLVVERADSGTSEATPDDGGATESDDGTESASGDDTVRADASSNEELAASDAASPSNEATAVANTGSESDDPVPTSRYAFDDDLFADVGAPAATQYENGPRRSSSDRRRSTRPSSTPSKSTGTSRRSRRAASPPTRTTMLSRTDGTVTVNGTTSAGDAYVVDGDLRSIHQTSGSTGFFVRYDSPIEAERNVP